jgi:hypothetical protein
MCFTRVRRLAEFQSTRPIAGAASYEAEVENNTRILSRTKPQKANWARINCDFPSVKDSMKEKPSMFRGQVGNIDIVVENPGEYEVKVLRANKLAKSLKFTVAPDGSLDNGIAKNRKLAVIA